MDEHEDIEPAPKGKEGEHDQTMVNNEEILEAKLGHSKKKEGDASLGKSMERRQVSFDEFTTLTL
jgi:hypothetical protein